MDYKKFLYEQKKREKQLKSKATKVVVKEIRFGPQTDEHDYAFKKKHAEKFLKDGAKLKAFVFFKGRSIFGRMKNDHHKQSKSQVNKKLQHKALKKVV